MSSTAALDYYDRHQLTPDDIGTDKVPAEISATLERLGVGKNGNQGETDSGSGENSSGKAHAAKIIESIGRDFVELRQKGRSPAWAELEDRLMTSAHILISAGMMSAKDWIGIARDIEEFRKQEQGTQVLPADFLAQWLSSPEPKQKKAVPRVATEVKPRRKPNKRNRESKD